MKIPDQINIFVEALLKSGSVNVTYSRPAIATGIWWLEIHVGSHEIDVSYQINHGFGFFEEEAMGLEFIPHLMYADTQEAIKHAKAQFKNQLTLRPTKFMEIKELRTA